MRHIPLLSGLFLLALITFGAGMWTTHKGWAPWVLADQARVMAKSYMQTGRIMREGTYKRRHRQQADARYVVNLPDQIAPGFLVINRLDIDTLYWKADLLDTEGNTLHTWTIDYSKLVPGGDPLAFVHPTRPLPDGSMVMVFDDDAAMGRIDACSEKIWARIDQTYHHSIHPEGDALWTWRSSVWDGGHDQWMVSVDTENGRSSRRNRPDRRRDCNLGQAASDHGNSRRIHIRSGCSG